MSPCHLLDVFLLTLPTIQYLIVFVCPLSEWAPTDHLERCTCPVVQRFINIQSASLLKILYSDLSIWKRDWTQTFSFPTNVADCTEEKREQLLRENLISFPAIRWFTELLFLPIVSFPFFPDLTMSLHFSSQPIIDTFS